MMFERQNIPLPVLELEPTRTPCDLCPKNRLWPEEGQPPLPFGAPLGLHPGNALAIQLYYYARDVQRVGVFDGAPLMRTVTLPGVEVVLNEFQDYLPTKMARQNMFAKILIIDEVATEILFKEEEARRDSRRRSEEAGRKKD